MPRIFKLEARWTAGFAILTFLHLVLTSCATAPSSKTYVGPTTESSTHVTEDASFQDLWQKRTIQIGPALKKRSRSFLSTPFSGSGGQGAGGGDNEFPLSVTATLMDSSLIEAGLRYFADRIEMTQDEEATFRSRYFDRYDPTNYLLIWCELRTGFAQNYLNLDRWIISIEDDAGNQYEPARIIGEPPSYRHMVMEKPLAFHPERGYGEWEIHHKRVMLCFPNRDFYGNLIPSKGVQSLKLVFQQIDDRKIREGGIWVFTHETRSEP
ncbi:MAG: hypothetical protein JSV84_05800 [Gemmatimonadota bacterium]|nr:MAG: hypothetical protein JSV84_05800 [Gemmatimonadota bacterium]